MLIGLCYVTPESSCRQNVDPDVFTQLTNDLVEFYHNYNGEVLTLIAGDFNGRTATEADFIVNDTTDHVPVPEFYVCDIDTGDGLPVRNSKDSVVNTYGRALLNFCNSTQFRIPNSRFGVDSSVGEFTCFSDGGVSLVDYMLAKKELIENVKNFEFFPCTVYSDHCQLQLTLDFTCKLNTNNTGPSNEAEGTRLKWDDRNIGVYIEALNAADTSQEKVLNGIEGNAESCIDRMANDFTDVLHDVADPIFRKQSNTHCKDRTRRNFKATWITGGCYNLREGYFQVLNRQRLNSTRKHYEAMKRARNVYTKEAKKCRLQYDRYGTEDLVSQRTKNAQEFWKQLKGNLPAVKSTLAADDFFKYFRDISNPSDITFTADEDVYEFVRNYDKGELEDMYSELNEEITVEEITRAVKQLKSGKAAGPDMLVNELYIIGSDVLLPKLTRLFNHVFKSGQFPEAQSEGLIVPVPKKGNVNNVTQCKRMTIIGESHY